MANNVYFEQHAIATTDYFVKNCQKIMASESDRLLCLYILLCVFPPPFVCAVCFPCQTLSVVPLLPPTPPSPTFHLSFSLISMPGAANPYIKITVGEHKRVTKTLKNTLSPQWDEHFDFDIDSSCHELLFTVGECLHQCCTNSNFF